MTTELDHVWAQIQGALRERVGERTYGLWLAPLRCVALDGDTLVLDGPARGLGVGRSSASRAALSRPPPPRSSGPRGRRRRSTREHAPRPRRRRVAAGPRRGRA